MKKILLLACLCTIAMLSFVACSCDDENDILKNQAVTISFESYTGEKISPQTIGAGMKATEPVFNSKRAGYKFMGWYDGDRRWDFEKNTVTKDLTLYAKWEKYLSFASVSEIESEYIKSQFSTEDAKGVIVTGCDYDIEDAVIPEAYNGKRVVGIYWAFANRSALKSVSIPSTVVFISANSFNNCPKLTRVVIPNSVTKIEAGAFSACPQLENILCEAESQPSGWRIGWNSSNCHVEWGYKKEG